MEPLPKGNYPATLIEAEDGYSENSGEPVSKMTFQFDPDAPNGAAGRKIKISPSLQIQALWKFKRIMTALGGLPADYFENNPGVDTDEVYAANMGRHAVLALDDPKDGSEFNEVKSVRPMRNTAGLSETPAQPAAKGK